MKATGSLLAAGILLALAGCSDPRDKAERTLREVGTPALRRDAAAYYKNLFAAPPARYFLPKANQWPASFQRFKPLRVRAYHDGFAIAVRDQPGMEEGIYIVPLGMDGAPGKSPSSHFQKIDDGIYWYRFAD